MINQAGSDYWNEGYTNYQLSFNSENILFKELFGKYISKGGTCLEVGCYPGNYLIYFGKYYDFSVSGIDTTSYILDRLPTHLAEHEIKVDNLYHADFLDFPCQTQYDLVYSFGFVEHFRDFKNIIKKHALFVKPGGTLIISCPNFRGIQYLLHKMLDSKNLDRHVVQSMDFKAWTQVLIQSDMEIVYQNYYRTADFWVGDPLNSRIKQRMMRYILKGVQVLNKFNYPNPLTSPYMISISRKNIK